MGAAPECGGRSSGDDGGTGLMGALGDSKWWPPGFRFHPTDEELVLYYLKRKVCGRRIRLPMIGDVDVYKWEPWELPERSVLRNGDKQWYFFSSRDRKYPNGSRCNRTTRCGYWKATGKDRTISQNSRAVGSKKTLVYHQGRAPKGQRTDWVMYEYTLDEQVLLRCNNVQDSYALYKAFRKSGPGPKNGEQYGAPFIEEEWNDDPDDSLRIQDNWVDSVSDHLTDGSVATVLGNNTNAMLTSVLEEPLLQMLSEQVAIQHHPAFPTYAPEVDAASEFGSHIVGPSYVDASSTKQSGGLCEQDCIDTGFNIPQSASTYVEPIETPEVTSLPICSEQGHLVTDEEFLEIKDFIDPESLGWSMDDISHTDHTHGTDGFYDPYDFFDPDMVLAETMGSLDATAPESYFDGFIDDEIQNQASHLTSELWAHEQPLNVPTAVESNQFVMASPASGALYDSSFSTLGGDTLAQINHAGSASESWFSSALSAFLDSIPSRPAIASENALISRALERVSSFKVGQIGAREPNTTTGGPSAVGRRQGGRNGGLLFISFLVGLGAIFWVLTIGAAFKVLKGLWGRFIAS